MPIFETYAPGTFCWVELATHDSEEAKRFYGDLFGWTYDDRPAGPGRVYTMLLSAGHVVGALYQMPGDEQAVGGAPRWLSYASVASVDEATARAGELGAKVVAAPFDVMESGRMSLLDDPTGAAFALWQPNRTAGASLVNEPGAWCWNELVTPDAKAAGDFYCGLFGWARLAQDMGGGAEYTTFSNAGRPAGGMYEARGEQAVMPPAWMVYFAVGDCDASAAQVQALGGGLVAPPTDAPGVGRYAVVADPQGAAFGIIKLEAPVA
jgi:predicted enzyme related to lactoylglutathione lyase